MTNLRNIADTLRARAEADDPLTVAEMLALADAISPQARVVALRPALVLFDGGRPARNLEWKG